jgi:O-antigen ligase
VKNFSIETKDYAIAISSSIFLFILPFTHTVAIRLSFLLITFLLVLKYYRFNNLQELPCKKTFLLWLALPFILLPFAIDLGYSLHEIKVEILYSLMAFSLFFSLAYQREFFLKIALGAMIASLLLVSVWGLLNSYFNHAIWDEAARHNGSASYISYSLILIPLLGLAAVLFQPYKILIIALLTVFILTSFLSGQRVFIVALLAELLVFSLWAKQYFLISYKKVIALTVVLLTVASMLSAASLYHRFNGSIDHIIDYQQHDPRFELVEIPINMVKQQPLGGYGFGRDAMLHVLGGEIELKKILADYPSGYQYGHTHNLFLNYAIEVGLVGLLIFLLLMTQLIRYYSRHSKDSDLLVALAGVAGVAILVGFLLRNQTNDMFYRDLSLYFWSTQGLLLGFIASRKQSNNRNCIAE